MNIATSIWLVIASCLSLAGGARRDLTEAEARGLVAIAVGKETAGLPQFGLDAYEDPAAAGFHVFEATAEHPRGGSPVIGQFAVNKATADVWRLGICERVHSKILQEAQASLRKKLRITHDELQRMSAKAPCQP